MIKPLTFVPNAPNLLAVERVSHERVCRQIHSGRSFEIRAGYDEAFIVGHDHEVAPDLLHHRSRRIERRGLIQLDYGRFEVRALHDDRIDEREFVDAIALEILEEAARARERALKRLSRKFVRALKREEKKSSGQANDH